MIGMLQELALDHAPDGVCTVGEMQVKPNSRNTIPGEVFFTIDMRHPDANVLDSMAGQLLRNCEDCARRHGIDIDVKEIWHNPPVQFDPTCIGAVSEAVEKLDYSRMEIVSGAGHDACQICRVAPTSMIFVPCAGGLSHNEHESAEPKDLEAGGNVLLHAMLKLAG